MDKKIKKIRLNDNDRRILAKNLGICTDSHGNGCGLMNANEHNRKLN